MDSNTQKEFMYLLERLGEPLYYGPKGDGDNLTFYNVPPMGMCESTKHASMAIKQNFDNVRRSIRIDAPATMPDLTNIARCCPKNTIYCHFNPAHRTAAIELRAIFMGQDKSKSFLSMASVCRDSELVNPKVWLNAFSSAILTRPDTRGFRMPAFWEIMPDEFLNSGCIRQAQRQSVMPSQDRAVIVIDQCFTGRNTDLENKLAYFREDMGINSHHWHWHIIYGLEEGRGVRDRKGELFYYMHHAMLARYETERLSNGLPRTKVLNIDEPIKEAYFSKLTDSNSGQLWGNRQSNTKIVDIDRTEDPAGLPVVRISLEEMRKYKDRIMEAIDTGTVLLSDAKTTKLNIDILGDMVESSTLTPNPQFYGAFGLHNIGHTLIAFSHDPHAKYREQSQPMGDTTTAMRDPVFYRWHKYVDDVFDTYKKTLQPYQDINGEFPLAWKNIAVSSVEVVTAKDNRKNELITFWMQSDIDLSRGLDFGRNNTNNLGPIWARKRHLNHDPFSYRIKVRNNTGSNQRTTLRVYMAPRLNENGERFDMTQQRSLFFEMDKFTAQMKTGDNDIVRQSTESSVTVPWEQTFRELERMENLTPQQAVCGCGWPQHMLVPKGTSHGMLFDIVVFLTNGNDDAVKSKNSPRSNCRESMSFCGILNDLYPDSKPMGYPFDRIPYLVPGTMNSVQVPVATLEQYMTRIPNMNSVQVRVRHMPSRIELRPGGAPSDTRVIMADSTTPSASACPETNPNNKPSGNSGNKPNQTRGGRSPSPESPNGSWTLLDSQRSRSSSPGWGYGSNRY